MIFASLKIFNANTFPTLGEWDASTSVEPIPPQEYNVARIFVNPSFTASNLRNNIAVLRLASPVTLGTVSERVSCLIYLLLIIEKKLQTPTVTTACLPSSLISANIRCWVAGWGKILKLYNNLTLILKKR